MQERDLFEFLKLNYYSDLVMAKNPMSKWDCYSVATAHRIELKSRKTHYDTLLIEKIKYESLVNKCHENLDLPMYICSTPKGVYRFNLYLFKNLQWETQWHNKTTEFSNRNKIPKEVAMLPVIDAEIL